MSERVKIACPECGAPLPTEAADAAVTCPQCGCASAPRPRVETTERTIVVERVVQGGAVSQPCPRCSVSLFAGNAHGITLLGCAICGGIFLDNEGSTQIVHAHDREIARLAERAHFRAAARGVDIRPRDLPCPMCTTPMKRVVVREVIEIDFCAAHGTWFDRQEIVRVMPREAGPPPGDESRARAEATLRAMQDLHAGAAEVDFRTTGSVVAGVTAGLLGILGALSAQTGSSR